MGTTKKNQWSRDFEQALSGFRAPLSRLGIGDNHPILKELDNARNAARRDIYHRGTRVGYDHTTNTPYLDPQRTNNWFPWPPSASTYSPSDYTQSDATDMEGVYLGIAGHQKSIVGPSEPLTELALGNQVVIWVKDHYYENQVGYVTDYRHQTNEYLIEIVSKRPYKRGYITQPGAKAQMWVKIEDVKLVKGGIQ